MMDAWALCFSLRRPVDRMAYARVGFGLMALKYLVDAALVYAVTGTGWTPVDYFALRPLDHWRTQFAGHGWVVVVMVLWTLPFVYVGASMTARRGIDAGFSGLAGALFFIPVVNYVWMIALCLLPSAPRQLPEAPAGDGESHLVAAALPSAVLGMSILLASIFLAGSYGGALFVGVPFAMGFAAGHRARRLGTRGSVVAAGQLSLLLVAGCLMLFALEGVLCLAMAAPIASLLALIGSWVGGGVAVRPGPDGAQALLVFAAFPLLLGMEASRGERPLREVASAVEVDAPPHVVWRHVIGFAELPPPSRLVFDLGIAYPVRARIEGAGVGAVRHCEFSTGAFVEPITHWEPPRRLAFDVASQPEPMQEWSPYQTVHAPHLLSGLRSRRGEFRLIELEGGRTRLEGSTWYTLDLGPAPYWALWSDALIAQIHRRVLEHVARLAERDVRVAVAQEASRSPRVVPRKRRQAP